MNVDMIDLEEFFSDEYKNVNNEGIGAVGIITQQQMVTRFNEEAVDKNTGKLIKGLGGHGKEELLIIGDIFNFDEEFTKGNGLMPGNYFNMSTDEKKVMTEVIKVRYLNSTAGNLIIIMLPSQNSITTNQLEAIKYIGDKVEEAKDKLNEPVQFFVGSGEEYVEEVDSVKKDVVPFLERFIDDSYEQAINDVNIIATQSINRVNIR